MTVELMCVWGGRAYEWIPYEFVGENFQCYKHFGLSKIKSLGSNSKKKSTMQTYLQLHKILAIIVLLCVRQL
jgi:hypothetical protein